MSDFGLSACARGCSTSGRCTDPSRQLASQYLGFQNLLEQRGTSSQV